MFKGIFPKIFRQEEKNARTYNVFRYFSSLAMSIFSILMSLYLFEVGYAVNLVLLYLAIKYFVSAALAIPLTKFGSKYGFRHILVFSIIAFCLMSIVLCNLDMRFDMLVYLGILSGVFHSTYWCPTDFFILKIFQKKSASSVAGITKIIIELASLPVVLIGGIILEKFNIVALVIITLIIYLLSVIPMLKIKEGKYKPQDVDIRVPFQKLTKVHHLGFILLGLATTAADIIWKLHLYNDISSDYEFIGIINIILGIAGIGFIYVVSKLLDKPKYDYLKISATFLAITWFIKLNIFSVSGILAITIIEGFILRMFVLTFEKGYISIGRRFNYEGFISYYYTLTGFFRGLFLTLGALTGNISLILLISVLLVACLPFIKFKEEIDYEYVFDNEI